MKWTLFDYGVGNLHSLEKAMAQHVEVEVVQDAALLQDAEAVVLPGVGAFAPVMDALAPAAEALRAHHAAGKPLVGVCIGMQVLFEASDEAPDVRGLGIIPGRVTHLDREAGKIPHMGWNTLEPRRIDPKKPQRGEPGPDPQRGEPGPERPLANERGQAPLAMPELLTALEAAGHVYYVHSYAAPVGTATLTTTRYGSRFSAVVQDGRTIGFQFHPEKSSHAGKAILGAALRALERT